MVDSLNVVVDSLKDDAFSKPALAVGPDAFVGAFIKDCDESGTD